ncbi:MAG: F0F1 ATP synthase subunit A [Flavobacteriales bacterium]|nr:F0F1 ATP synthase subunit A [Flavobacteriales bacterium]
MLPLTAQGHHENQEHADQPATEVQHTEDHAANHEAEAHEEEKLDFGAFIKHHIADDYVFQIIGNISFPLPVIIYEPGKGFDVFMSSAFHHADENHLTRDKYYYHHGKLYIPELDENGQIKMDEHGHPIGKHEATLGDLISGNKHIFYNFSITKNVFGLLLAVVLLLIIFISVAKAYKQNPNRAPRGLQGAMEPLILFVQNEIAIPFIGEKKYTKFLPYLLTLFFFIWINNLLGLIPIFPGSANVTGNIAVTMTLALFSLIMVLINGNKHFWGHLLNPPGVPFPVKIILVPIEIIGIFTKPFSLMIRLFANITAGHIIIMSIIGITFIVQSYVVGVVTSVFSVAMFTLELLVAAIQAYIFTLLTAQMIGGAVEEGHGHGDHHEHDGTHH